MQYRLEENSTLALRISAGDVSSDLGSGLLFAVNDSNIG